MKRQVTQEELDAVYAVLRAEAEKLAAGAPGEAALEQQAAPTGKLEGIGIHIGAERTNVLYVGAKQAIVNHIPINVGFDDMDRLLKEVMASLPPDKKMRPPVYLTLTGKHAHFITAKVPKLSRGQMVRAMKVQLKHSSGDDWDDIEFAPIPSSKKSEEPEYAVGAINKSVVEKIFRHLKRQALKINTWDVDTLCYARAANLIWQKQKIESSTRFMILLDWDSCRLIVQSPDGRLITAKLTIGINSFLEHLLKTWEALGPRDGANAGGALGAEPIELRERNVLANQAIHDVYVPLGQQIKTQLFAGCNEHGVPLPSHFCVVSTGANLFRLIESLSLDLGLRPIAIERMVPVEAMAALGATQWDKADLKLNFLPRGNQEMFRTFREWLQGLKAILPKKSPIELPEGVGATAGIAAIAGVAIGIIGVVAYPLFQRHKVNSQTDKYRKEMAALEGEKKRIATNKERQALVDRKVSMVKVIAARRPQMSHALKELFSAMPGEVRISSLMMRGDTLNMKGLSKNAPAVETFLKKAMELRLLKDPTPLGIRRSEDDFEFEITFKFRS